MTRIVKTSDRPGEPIRAPFARISSMTMLPRWLVRLAAAGAIGLVAPLVAQDTGYIYFFHMDGVGYCRPDGSGRTMLPALDNIGGVHIREPSLLKHPGRWWLSFRPVVGQSYPDQRQRYELAAVDDATGTFVPLSADPNLQPILRSESSPEDARACWVLNDTVVTWKARHYGVSGQVDALGIYFVDIDWSTGVPVASAPPTMLVDFTALPYNDTQWGLMPDVAFYDWAPGTPLSRFAYGRYSAAGVWIGTVADPTPQLLTSTGGTPMWSPNPLIPFIICNRSGDQIWMINVDENNQGTNLRMILSGSRAKGTGQPTDCRFSPNGTHLTYCRKRTNWTGSKAVFSNKVMVSLNDGSTEKRLFGEAGPMAWVR